MIQVKHMDLFHFCRFDKLSLDVQPGLTRIAGPNGSGKTTVFRALIYGLTGWCDPAWGTQSDLQQDDESVPGYVELTLSVDGEEYTLKRFAGTGTKLVDTLCKDGAIIVKNRQKINAWLEQFTGIAMPVMAQLMWLRQENSSWLLTATAAQINQFLGLIFDTKKLETYRQHLKNACDSIPKLRDDFDTRKKQAAETLHQQSSQKELLSQQLQEQQELVRATKETLQAFGNSMAVADRDKMLRLREQELAAYSRDLDKYRDLQEAPAVDIETETAAETALVSKISAQRLEKSTCERMLNSARADRDNSKWRLDQLRHIHTPDTCELCGCNLSTSPETYRNNKVKLLLQQALRYEEAIKNFSETYEISAHKCIELEKRMALLEHDIASDNKELESIGQKRAERLRYMEQLQHKTELQHKIEQVAAEIEKLKATPVYDASISKQQIESMLRSAEARETELKSAYETCIASIAAAQQVMHDAEEDAVRYKRNERVRQVLSTLRDVLSQSRAQARYLNSKISTLNGNIAHYLQLSEMPFTVFLDPAEHVFKYRMDDCDMQHQAGMLSGAQKAAAAIAIQMSLVVTAVPDLTLLLLDEADASLSPENKVIATKLYRVLAETLSGSDGSTLVISQSDTVAAECDREITL